MHPPGAEPGRHLGRGRTTRPVGGGDSGRLPTLPLVYYPAPDPRSQSALPPRGRGRFLVYFAGGFAPGTPEAGACGSVQGGKESVAYRLARAVRVQPRGCKGRSPLHEITLVSPSPEGKGRGDGSKTPFGFRRGSAPGTPAAGAYGSAQRGKESVAYRLARAVRVQPRGCKGRSPLHEITLVSPSPEGKGRGDGSKTPFGFRRGSAPGTPAAGAYGSAQRGKESVAYRLARAVRVQPRGCKGRSPLHEITLVSPSPEGKGQGDGGKTPFGFRRGLSPGGADSTLDIPFLSALAGRTDSSQYKFEKSSGGSGGLFQESPSVSPASPPRLQRFSFSGRWCRLWYRPV